MGNTAGKQGREVGGTMKSGPGMWALLGVVLAVVVGFTLGADFMSRSAVGLDPSAFPAGEWMQRVGEEARWLPRVRFSG